MDKRYSFDDFKEIIRMLRSEQGCPWDREQTHSSLTRCMVEEAYEVVDGIRIREETGSADNLCEELGDVLLQVVMHSQIAEEAGEFTCQDVIQGVSEKMIRRHPHVFGSGNADTAQEVLVNWEEIKRREKQSGGAPTNPLREVPHSLPALIRTEKVQKKMDSLYGELPAGKVSLAAAQDHIQKLLDDENSGNLAQDFGEILWNLCNAARKNNVRLEEALIEFMEKNIRKMDEKP